MHEISKIIDPQTQANIDLWLSGPYSEESKNEIRRLNVEDQKSLIDSFYRHLSFGTGGLRGIMGVGTNRMNEYTVRAASQGLADYIKTSFSDKILKVVISYDSRNQSKFFAEESAKVLIGNGILVLMYRELRPVPMVSFGVRYHKAHAGVMITASHNPPEYNGYKVYWQDGCQVLPPHDVGIIEAVKKIRSPNQVLMGELKSPFYELLGEDMDRAYAHAVAPLAFYPSQTQKGGDRLKIVYTSLHGAGSTMIPKLLNEWGFKNIHLVEKQCTPDGNFPTVKSPNPEEHAAMQLGIDTMEKVSADIVIATDPDTDRMGVVAKNDQGYELFNGNQIVSLMMEYVLSQSKKLGRMPSSPHVIKTIVTTELCYEIAKYYEVQCLNVLTGFKYIGEKISTWEKEQKESSHAPHYIFGGEESYGYLYGTHVRDKDAVICSLLAAELAFHYKEQGLTLSSQLRLIYQKYGVFSQKMKSLQFKGKEGADTMQELMTKLRKHPPLSIGSKKIHLIEDYFTLKRTYPLTGKQEPLSFPKSNVILFRLEDESKIVMRPSGTEPKLKIYGEVIDKQYCENLQVVEDRIHQGERVVSDLINQLVSFLGIDEAC